MALLDSSPSIDWEDSKENLVPVKQGRTMAASPLGLVHSTVDLEKEKRRLLDEIGAAGSSDPLPAWQRYIKWTQETYATGGKKSELQKALEACTKALSTTDRYNNDPRYLRLWIQYADGLPDPNDVFMYLRTKGIGEDLALLYEAQATFLELKGSYSKAEQVFQEGLSRMAHPVERLRQKHAAFKQRMARREERKAQEQALGLASGPAPPGPRASLHQLHQAVDENGRPIQSSSQHGRSQAVPSNRFALPPQPLAAQRQQQTLTGLKTNVPAPALEICVDEEFEDAPAAAGPAAALPFLKAGQPGHHPLPEYARGRKENDDKAGKWAGAPYKQNTALAYPSSSKLDICEDDEFSNDDKPHSQPQPGLVQEQQQQHGRENPLLPSAQQQLSHRPAAGASTQPKLEQSDHHNPIAAIPGPAQPLVPEAPSLAGKTGLHEPAAAAAGNKAGAPSNQDAGPSSSGRGGVPGGYDSQLLMGPDGTEQCFEEARAAAWKARQQARHKQQQQQVGSCSQSSAVGALPASVTSLKPRSSCSSSSNKSHHQEPLLAAAEPPPEVSYMREHSGSTASTSQRTSARGAPATAARAEPTVTINTRQALEAMNYMFSDDLPTTYLGGQPQLASDPTITMSTRAALDAMNSMFSEDLPTTRLPGTARSGMAAAPPRVGSDPTITMSTRAALNALNGMFCDDMPTGTVDVRVAAAGCAEPTMTFHSRAALDMVNGMFNDATTQPLRGQRRGPSDRRGGDYTATAAPGGGPAVAVYEDTEFLTVGLSRCRLSCAPGEMSLGLYEDTEFLPAGGGAPSTGAAAGPDSPGLTGDKGGGLAIYEDTEFVGGGGATGGLGLYQDTEFLTNRFTGKQAPPVPAARRGLGAGLSRAGVAAAAAAQGAGASDSTTGLLRVKENMPAHMLGRECSSAGPSPMGSPEGVVGGSALHRPGSGAPNPRVQHMDSFVVMDSPAVKAAGLPPLNMSPVGAISPYGPKENYCVSPKQGHLPMRKAAQGQPLCPLSRSRAAALGVALVEQYSPEAAPVPTAHAAPSGTPQKAMRSLFRERRA